MAELEPAVASASAAAPSKSGGSLIPKVDIQNLVKQPWFAPAVLLLAAITFCYWPLLEKLPELWFNDEGYYSHGVLVPLISGYVVWKWWPRLQKIKINEKPAWIALLPLLVTCWLLFAGIRGQQTQIMSVSLVTSILWGIWFVLGWRWMLAVAGPVLYLLFMLPVFTAFIDNYTNPLQVISTEVSYGLLQVFGFEVLKDGATTIHMNTFVLDVGVPCSGLKLVLAVSAFTLFFMMIGGLKWWGNLMMLIAVFPLCLIINGLRIALIGVVGEMYGKDAGHQFHDYSGYITLLICFFLLFKLARLLGWND